MRRCLSKSKSKSKSKSLVCDEDGARASCAIGRRARTRSADHLCRDSTSREGEGLLLALVPLCLSLSLTLAL